MRSGRRSERVEALLRYLRSIDPASPWSVWILNLGGLANALGHGLAFPFLIICLHNAQSRLPTAGLVLATTGAVSLLAGPGVGIVVDRISGRAALAAALVLLAIGSASTR